MNEKQARNLLPHTVVMWDGNPEIKGTVCCHDHPGRLHIVWEDGEPGCVPYTEKERLSKISLWQPKEYT